MHIAACRRILHKVEVNTQTIWSYKTVFLISFFKFQKELIVFAFTYITYRHNIIYIYLIIYYAILNLVTVI